MLQLSADILLNYVYTNCNDMQELQREMYIPPQILPFLIILHSSVFYTSDCISYIILACIEISTFEGGVGVFAIKIT